MNEKITVLVPVYNMGKYLRTCFDSILAQTYPNFELLAIDDGSTDESPAICDEYAEKDPRVRVIHTHNQGQDMARNTGLRNIHTDYIAMVDADDCVNCRFLEYSMAAMQKTGADIAYCASSPFENDNEINYMEELPDGLDEVVCHTSAEQIKLLCTAYTTRMVVPHKLYRRAVFDGVWYPPVRVNIDEWTIHHLLLNCKKIASIKTQAYYYRNSPEGMTRNFSVKKISGVKALIDRIETLRSAGYEELLPFVYKRFFEVSELFYRNCKKYGVKLPKEFCALKPNFREAYRIAISKQTDTFDRKQRFCKKMFGYNFGLYAFLSKLFHV